MDRDWLIRQVVNRISLVASRPLMEGRGLRRVLRSEEIAQEVSPIPVKDVNRIGRQEGRLYLDIGERQVRATYEGAGRWRINSRARYW